MDNQPKKIRIKKQKKGNIFKSKLLFTFLIILAYIAARCIPLYCVDINAFMDESIGSDILLFQSIGGDLYKTSILALGLAPYISGSIIVQMYAAIKKAGSKSQVSPKTIGTATVTLVMIFAVVQAYLQVEKLEFIATDVPLIVVKGVAMLEMIVGALLIMRLSTKNKEYGIGGQTALIFVNIVDGIMRVIISNFGMGLIIPVVISLMAMIIMIMMEGIELRTPVQRIGIQSVYADKNYLAIKANPTGVMPIMFTSAAFMLPQALLGLLVKLRPENRTISYINTQMNLNSITGIIVYLILLIILTVVFAFLFIDPSNISEQLLKSGDSIVNLHAGPPTKKYIYSSLLHMCALSAVVMCLCVGVPLFLQYFGVVNGKISMLPTSFMMLSGMFCNLYIESVAVSSFDEYVPFL